MTTRIAISDNILARRLCEKLEEKGTVPFAKLEAAFKKVKKELHQPTPGWFYIGDVEKYLEDM